MEFGLICEGKTDQAAIENMLCGILEDDELFDLITELQPGGTSDSNQDGGWERVFEYLGNHKFRQSFSTVKRVVIQIDTDVAHLKGFDVDLRDEQGITLKKVISIVEQVKDKLIEKIESGQAGFYDKHKERIIFAITVHSLEIWLYKHHSKKPTNVKIINSGENKLAQELEKKQEFKNYVLKGKGKKLEMDKNYDNYDNLTRAFYNKKTRNKAVKNLCLCDDSFKLFKEQLMP